MAQGKAALSTIHEALGSIVSAHLPLEVYGVSLKVWIEDDLEE